MDLKLVMLVLSSVALATCEHLVMGDPNGKQMVYHTVERYNAIPFIIRDKDFFFNETNQRVISSIVAYDNISNNSSSKAIITAGGLGFPFVNIKMTSERGKPMEYDIGIYI